MRDIIERYFACWLNKDGSELDAIFSDNVIYSECYGPEYVGKEQIVKWFHDWNKKGSVLQWNIKQFIEQGNMIVVEWFFECDYQGNKDGFDGVTIAMFDDNNQICNLKEFQSKAEHYNPNES